MTPVALVPVNRLEQAKGRLAALLAPEERTGLATRTLRTVLDATLGAGLETAVLTADPAVAALLPAGVRHLPEASNRHGLNAQLEYARETLDAPALLILHADLPLADAEAIQRLLAAAPPAPSVTLVESLDGGTNAMLLQPPGGVALAYGPASAAAHREAATASGYAVAAVEEPSLRLDLDTRDDLARLLATAEGHASRAGSYLVEIGIPERLAGKRAP